MTEINDIKTMSESVKHEYNSVAWAIGLLPVIVVLVLSFIVLSCCVYSSNHLTTNAITGNLESDVEKRLGEPDIIFDNKADLYVDKYQPTPAPREADEIVGYKRGKYLMYVFYKDNKVLATFISKK